jgi:hypothetical protein
MEAVIISAVLFSSFAGAFMIQKVTLEGLFRIMEARCRYWSGRHHTPRPRPVGL